MSSRNSIEAGGNSVEPFLKWAGGKRWLVKSNQLPQPACYERYIEPFLGGGAVFFSLPPHKSILSDINGEIIDLYNTIKYFPEELMHLMQAHQIEHNTEYYYFVRNNLPTSKIARAARTLYLNRTCWNGLYRVNLRGAFNVPIGTKTSVVFPHDNFLAIAEHLRNAEIRNSDFEEVILESKEKDFLFIDPPYTVKHNTNGFVKYNENIFSWQDQIRLRNAVSIAIDRGASVVITNADHESVRELYRDICNYKSIERTSILASEAARRVITTEALFYANID